MEQNKRLFQSRKKKMLSPKNISVTQNKPIENDSLQYNAQDLDQEQNTTINPMLLNSQNLHVHVHSNNQYASHLSGATYLLKSKVPLSNTTVLLYFASDSNEPVCEATTDKQGEFKFIDLPPGFYILFACCGEYVMDKSKQIKLLPGQSIDYSLFLSWNKKFNNSI